MFKIRSERLVKDGSQCAQIASEAVSHGSCCDGPNFLLLFGVGRDQITHVTECQGFVIN